MVFRAENRLALGSEQTCVVNIPLPKRNTCDFSVFGNMRLNGQCRSVARADGVNHLCHNLRPAPETQHMLYFGLC